MYTTPTPTPVTERLGDLTLSLTFCPTDAPGLCEVLIGPVEPAGHDAHVHVVAEALRRLHTYHADYTAALRAEQAPAQDARTRTLGPGRALEAPVTARTRPGADTTED